MAVSAIVNKVGVLHRSTFLILTQDPSINKLAAHWIPKVLHNKDQQILSFWPLSSLFNQKYNY